MSHTEKQLQILEVAERLFADQGFDGTSIRDIAEEAGVNIAMISYYFGSKEKLMQSIFEQRMDQNRIRLESMLKDESMAPLSKLELLIEENIERYFKRQQFYKIMVCEQITNKNPVIINFVYELKKRNTELISELIKDGQNKGVFNKDVDVVLLLNILFGSIMQALINKESYRDFNKLQSLSDADFNSYLRKQLTKQLKIVFKAILTYEA